MKKVIFLLTGIISFYSVVSQETGAYPSGKPFATIFANFHKGLYGEAMGDAAFELARGYIGYEYSFSPEFYAKINLDIGSPNDLSPYSALRRYAYFKNAYLKYSRNKFEVEFGLITLKQFNLQEKIWERRYLMKPFADEYKLGSSADLGINIHYTVSKQMEVDLTMMNGEGYNNIQSDGIFKYAVGSTFRFARNFTSKVYADYYYNQVAESSVLLFGSYDHKNKWNLSGEFILKLNDGWDKGHHIYGTSVYAKYNLTGKYQLFARYDWVASNIIDGEATPWHLADDGTALVGGIQFAPINNIKLALNYHDWCPWAANQEGQGFIYLDMEVKF